MRISKITLITIFLAVLSGTAFSQVTQTCPTGTLQTRDVFIVPQQTPTTVPIECVNQATGQLVFPNAAAMAQSHIVFADQYSSIQAAVNACNLDTTCPGVEARTLLGGGTESATIAVTRPMFLNMPSRVLNGCPGINVQSSSVVISGNSWAPGGEPGGTILTSGASATNCPLIQNTFNGADHTSVQYLEMNCNSIGGFGYFGPFGSFSTFRAVRIHNCKYSGMFTLQGIDTYQDVWSTNNGEGGVLASDGNLYGQTEYEANTYVGLHVISGGSTLTCQSCDSNGTYGIYVDGRTWGNWVTATSYVNGAMIKPTTGNPGGYYFYEVTPGTSGAGPTWTQAVGAYVSDGTVTWVNVGQFPPANSVSYTSVEAGYVDDNCGNGVLGDNIRVEGPSAADIRLWGIHTAQGTQTTKPCSSIHLLNTSGNVTITSVDFLGSAFGGAGADPGGIIFENSSYNVLQGFSSQYAAKSAVQFINSGYNVISNLSLVNTAQATTPGANAFGLTLDAASVNNSFANVLIQDNRGTNYSKGISDAGTNNYVIGYKLQTAVATPDSLGTMAVMDHDVGTGQFQFKNKPVQFLNHMNLYNGFGFFGYSDAGVTQKFVISAFDGSVTTQGKATFVSMNPGSVAFASLPGSPANGDEIYCSNCTVTTPASCTNVTATAACTCIAGGTGAMAKRVNGVWLCE